MHSPSVRSLRSEELDMSKIQNNPRMLVRTEIRGLGSPPWGSSRGLEMTPEAQGRPGRTRNEPSHYNIVWDRLFFIRQYSADCISTRNNSRVFFCESKQVSPFADSCMVNV